MYLPSTQSIITAGLALTGTLTKPKTISSGTVLDFAVPKCIDADNNVRCSKPFLITKSTCYTFSWSTEGTFTHTTLELRDAGSDELIYYRDTDGDWDEAQKNELVYLDFMPKVPGTGNQSVEYEVRTCG